MLSPDRPHCRIQAGCRARGTKHCPMCAAMARRDGRLAALPTTPDPAVVEAVVEASRATMRERLARALADRSPKRRALTAAAVERGDNTRRGIAARPSLYLSEPSC